jgi:hypothetical protein
MGLGSGREKRKARFGLKWKAPRRAGTGKEKYYETTGWTKAPMKYVTGNWMATPKPRYRKPARIGDRLPKQDASNFKNTG